MNLKDKNVLVGIAGSSAAMSMPYYIYRLKESLGKSPEIVLTSSAEKFVSRASLSLLTGKYVHQELWSSSSPTDVTHMKLAKWVDVILVLPASAHIISQVATGQCSELLPLIILASRADCYFVPSMNADMWNSRVVQRNCRWLEELGHRIIPPGIGKSLSDEDDQVGAMPAFEEILQACFR